MKTRLTHFLAGGALLFTVGCSSSGDVTNGSIATNGPLAGSNRSLTIVEPDFATLQRDGDLVNALEVEAFDASGERVLGPVDIPISQRNVVNDIPPTATTIQIDYLRNSGFMLFRAEVPYTGQAEIQDPRQEALPYHNTTWKVSAQGQGLRRERNSPRPGPQRYRGARQGG